MALRILGATATAGSAQADFDVSGSRRAGRRLLFVANCLAIAGAVATAQGPPPGTPPGVALNDVAAAESLRVLASLDELVRTKPRDATAWHRRGLVAWNLMYRARIGPDLAGADWTRLGRVADTSLRRAVQLAPNDARIVLSTAQFFLASGQSLVRAQSYNMFGRALDLARTTRNSVLISEALIEQARVYWRRYDTFANRRIEPAGGFARSLFAYNAQGRAFSDSSIEMTAGDALAGDPMFLIPIERVVDRLNRNTQALPASEMGAADYERAEALFREAHRYAPDRARPFEQLAMLLAEKRRWPELASLARDRLRRRATDAPARFALGLALKRQGRIEAGGAQFDSALAALSSLERANITNLARVIPPQDRARFATRTAAERDREEWMYWRFVDPLWSRGGSDARTEFLARVAFAELRWTVQELGVRGIDSDRGEIHLRFGPPDLEAVLGPQPQRADIGSSIDMNTDRDLSRAASRSHFDIPRAGGANEMLELASLTTLWAYRPGWLFVFRGAPTYATARIPPQDDALVDSLLREVPAFWRNAGDETVIEMPSQVARFRAARDSVDIVVATEPPVNGIREATTSNALIRADFWLFGNDNAVSRHDSASVRTAGPRAWTSRVEPGTYAFRVETTSEGALLAGRATDWIVAEPESPRGSGFASRGFGLSDVLLVGTATPRAGATRWHDIDIEPTAGTIRFGGQLALVWENYELAPSGGGGSANYSVMIAVERRYREALNRIRARVVGAFAAIAGVERTADRVILRYDRSAPHAPVVLDHLTIGLDETPPGEYRLTLVITDKTTGRSAERVQRFVITP